MQKNDVFLLSILFWQNVEQNCSDQNVYLKEWTKRTHEFWHVPSLQQRGLKYKREKIIKNFRLIHSFTHILSKVQTTVILEVYLMLHYLSCKIAMLVCQCYNKLICLKTKVLKWFLACKFWTIVGTMQLIFDPKN